MNYTDEEKRVIRLLAGTHLAQPRLREDAIAAHRAMMLRCLRSNVTKGGTLPYGDSHFEFMREVDNTCPDLTLRAMHRAEVVRQSTIVIADESPLMRDVRRASETVGRWSDAKKRDYAARAKPNA